MLLPAMTCSKSSQSSALLAVIALTSCVALGHCAERLAPYGQATFGGLSCNQWAKAGLPCPEGFEPSSFHSCSPGSAACPLAQDPASQYLSQAGLSLVTWPRLQRAAAQTLELVCGTSVRHHVANVGCSAASVAYVAVECIPGELDGVHAAVSGHSTAAVYFTSIGSGGRFSLALDASMLLPGTHQVCIDLHGPSALTYFKDMGLRLELA
eukprot:TRINITY_DN14525_c0_g1_i2.p1 TRINITY_DN14525_c0_g1~~TRINITY_DN14525_c0_g1_i2.p1  ORF type:complete len:235 (-),score=36.09 TRINITY_DN14525_c0_g1_i2:51-680(-)